MYRMFACIGCCVRLRSHLIACIPGSFQPVARNVIIVSAKSIRMKAIFLTCVLLFLGQAMACTDFYMNFTDHRLSARTVDLGLTSNWTITAWPRAKRAVDILANKIAGWSAPLATIGFTANWFGDDVYGFPSLFGDALNEKGVSCSLQSLVGTQYEDRADDKLNIFAGLFCHFVASNYGDVMTLKKDLDNIRIWGPDVLAQHFAVRDVQGNSLIIECMGGRKRVYLDTNDGVTGYGIMTNEPTFDWHLENIAHYTWKRTLSRQAIATPGNFYPEERFLRVHMIKAGMQSEGMFSNVSYQTAVSLTAQV
ncbi:linear amide C-N hydrolase [archaeon]|nr:MAG: linear amide C-N hydrolase [archaeon]